MIPVVMASAALAVAAVSAFSIIGLTAVFTGARWAVVAMGAAMECAKLSAVAWLGRRYACLKASDGVSRQSVRNASAILHHELGVVEVLDRPRWLEAAWRRYA
jgi:hypothetical protein